MATGDVKRYQAKALVTKTVKAEKRHDHSTAQKRCQTLPSATQWPSHKMVNNRIPPPETDEDQIGCNNKNFRDLGPRRQREAEESDKDQFLSGAKKASDKTEKSPRTVRRSVRL